MRIVRIFMLSLSLFLSNVINAQNKVIHLKVIDIKELDDAVSEIRAMKESGDIIRILSIKGNIEDECLYEKIRKGAEYQFELRPESVYIDNYIVRIGETIYWKTGDNPKDLPYFAENLKGNYIKK